MGPVRVQQPEIPLRARTRFRVLVVQSEDEAREHHARTRRRSGRRFSRELFDDIAVVNGGVVNVGANLVVVSAAGPTRFGDPDPDIRVPESLHRENQSVHHLIEEVVVGQARNRVGVGDVGRCKESVVQIDVDWIRGPREERVDIDEEEGLGFEQKLQHGFDDGTRNIRPKRTVGGWERRLEHVHGQRSPHFNFGDSVGLESMLDFAHCRNEIEPDLLIGRRENFVSDEQVPNQSLWVKGHHIGVDPLVGECLIGGNVVDELVRDHNRDLQVCVSEGLEDFGVGIVDFDPLGFQRLDELHRF